MRLSADNSIRWIYLVALLLAGIMLLFDSTIRHIFYLEKHKKDIEDFLINGNNKFLIIRLAKIFGTEKDDGTLLTSWLNQLKGGEEIFCAEDQFFCPTHIDDLVKALRISL